MFLLFGTRGTQSVINVIAFVCGYCHQHAQQRVVRRRTMFTVFFIPLFPVSTRYINECTNCGGMTRVTADQARHSIEWSAGQAGGA